MDLLEMMALVICISYLLGGAVAYGMESPKAHEKLDRPDRIIKCPGYVFGWLICFFGESSPWLHSGLAAKLLEGRAEVDAYLFARRLYRHPYYPQIKEAFEVLLEARRAAEGATGDTAEALKGVLAAAASQVDYWDTQPRRDDKEGRKALQKRLADEQRRLESLEAQASLPKITKRLRELDALKGAFQEVEALGRQSPEHEQPRLEAEGRDD